MLMGILVQVLMMLVILLYLMVAFVLLHEAVNSEDEDGIR